jgi:hypothetical protein
MRVRISFDALRLCLLVAAGVTSGYLWRAAFESSSPAEERIAATPRVIHPTPAAPTVRIPPRQVVRPVRHRPARARTVVVTRTPASVISRSGSSPASKPKPTPEEPKPTPTPTSPPPPQPQSTPPTSASVAGSTAQVTTPPPSTSNPPPGSQPPPSSQPPSSQPPPSQGDGDDGSRPGWGHGDKNHDHDGPGGGKKNP